MQSPHRGDPLSIGARDWGDMLRVVERYRNGQIKFDAPTLETAIQSATTAKVLNESGSNLDQCAVIGLGAPIITPTLNQQEFIRNFAFRTVAPLPRRWGIVQGPIPAGEIGTVCIAGATACKIVVTDESLPVNFITVESGVLVPSYASGDATVLWREGGTGEQWAIIRIGQVATTHHLFTLTADMDAGIGIAEISDMDDTVTIETAAVYDSLGIFAELAEGARGICVLQLGKYYIIQAECGGE